jgi:hypothetical protein
MVRRQNQTETEEMTKKIILSRHSKQKSTPWFETKYGFKVKLTHRSITTVSCNKNDLKDFTEDEIKELKKSLDLGD